MPTITKTHSHTFSDGKKVTKDCTMTFGSSDNPDLVREHESVFKHPRTGETFTWRFEMTKRSKNNSRTYTDDRDDGYDSEGVVRYKTY